jgi:proline racemase
MGKGVRRVEVEEVPEFVKEEVAVPDKRDGTGKFQVVAYGGKFYVYSPEGVRINAGDGEVAAEDLARRMQSFKR